MPTPYTGPETFRDSYPFYTYGPTVPAVLRWNWWTRLWLWWVVWRLPFTNTGPVPETPEWWCDRGEGDCATFAFTLRAALERAGFPAGAFPVAWCARTPELAAKGDGHLVLMANTDKGALACEILHREWRWWDEYGYHDWNREAIG